MPVARVRQPQVQVVVGGQGVEQLDLGDRQAGVAEQRQPRREVELGPAAAARASRHAGRGVAAHRSARPRRCQSLGCQARSSSRRPPTPSVASSVEPVDEQLRTLDGVRREEAGEPPRDRVAAAPAQLGLVTLVEVPEVGRQGAAPGLVEALRRAPRAAATPVASGAHGSSLRGAGQLGDQRARGPELHPRADTVTARAGARAGGTAAG